MTTYDKVILDDLKIWDQTLCRVEFNQTKGLMNAMSFTRRCVEEYVSGISCCSLSRFAYLFFMFLSLASLRLSLLVGRFNYCGFRASQVMRFDLAETVEQFPLSRISRSELS